jgi:DNA polymerase IV (DinB-like DNA polymerase)
MLVDLDYFYAQVEEKRNPLIKEKPVVVCVYSGRTSESGVVSTANYIARSFGVKSGMPIALAKKKLVGVDSVFLPVDHDHYKEVSNRIMSILGTYADGIEQEGIDEAYLDVSARTEGDFDKAAALGLMIKNDLKKQEELTCSVGIGPNKLIAKIASDIKKPDGLTVIKPDEVKPFLEPLPVDRLLGVGKKTSEKLKAMGVVTVGDLARYEIKSLIECFGESLGAYLHNASRGIDQDPVQDRGESGSLSRISTLKEDTRDLKLITKVTDQLCEDVHQRLMQRRVSFKLVGIVAVMKDLTILTRSKTFADGTNDLGFLKKEVGGLFDRLLKDTDKKVRRAGVRVSCFSEDEGRQELLTNFLK